MTGQFLVPHIIMMNNKKKGLWDARMYGFLFSISSRLLESETFHHYYSYTSSYVDYPHKFPFVELIKDGSCVDLLLPWLLLNGILSFLCWFLCFIKILRHRHVFNIHPILLPSVFAENMPKKPLPDSVPFLLFFLNHKNWVLW